MRSAHAGAREVRQHQAIELGGRLEYQAIDVLVEAVNAAVQRLQRIAGIVRSRGATAHEAHHEDKACCNCARAA